ncbi:MAG: hypothetical protein NT029_21460 [Armatimonadetes bacterium]|nr:hypothetical protein [Armatimonadota bacterium]
MKGGIEIPPPVAAAIIVVLVLVVGFFVYRSAGPKPLAKMDNSKMMNAYGAAMGNRPRTPGPGGVQGQPR